MDERRVLLGEALAATCPEKLLLDRAAGPCGGGGGGADLWSSPITYMASCTPHARIWIYGQSRLLGPERSSQFILFLILLLYKIPRSYLQNDLPTLSCRNISY